MVLLNGVTVGAGTSEESAAVAFGHSYDSAVLSVAVNVGAGVELVTLSVQGRSGGGSWLPVAVVNLGEVLGDLVTSVPYTADYTCENALVIPTPIEEFKVVAANTGASDAVVTVKAFLR